MARIDASAAPEALGMTRNTRGVDGKRVFRTCSYAKCVILDTLTGDAILICGTCVDMNHNAKLI